MLNRRNLWSILFWSVIAAAFIGPGTVTTAAGAGAIFKLDLLWTLIFSVFVCIVLQEAAARITILSGYTFGEAIASKFRNKGKYITIIMASSVIFGCAAYQAGNILGAVEGLSIIYFVPHHYLTLIIGALSFLCLFKNSYRYVARILSIIVALMGIVFLWAAIQSDYSVINISTYLFKPNFPTDSSLYILALIGTTVVPYNLFLASGISKGQNLKEMRFGLIVAIVIGGFISVAILIVGTIVEGDFSFQLLAKTLEKTTGVYAVWILGIGLFAAGFSSSVTAPLASAITAKSLLGKAGDIKWNTQGKYYQLVWGGVLVTGLLFGFFQLKPIPIILMAQAINGLLLPVICFFLTLALNDSSLLTSKQLNTFSHNILMVFITFISTFLGLNTLIKVFISTSVLSNQLYIYIGIISLFFIIICIFYIYHFRKK